MLQFGNSSIDNRSEVIIGRPGGSRLFAGSSWLLCIFCMRILSKSGPNGPNLAPPCCLSEHTTRRGKAVRRCASDQAGFSNTVFPGPRVPGNCHPICVTVVTISHANSATAFCVCCRYAMSIGVSHTIFCLFTKSGSDLPSASGVRQEPWHKTFRITEAFRSSLNRSSNL